VVVIDDDADDDDDDDDTATVAADGSVLCNRCGYEMEVSKRHAARDVFRGPLRLPPASPFPLEVENIFVLIFNVKQEIL